MKALKAGFFSFTIISFLEEFFVETQVVIGGDVTLNFKIINKSGFKLRMFELITHFW